MPKMELTTPNQLTTPVWLADFGSRDHLIPAPARLDASQFTSVNSVTVTTTAAAAAGATALTVAALSGAVPAGTVLYFSDADAYATTTANAAAAATSITVAALERAVPSGAKAIYGAGFGRKFVPSGTLVGRTITERDAGTGYGPADVPADADDTAFDDEIYLTFNEVFDAAMNPDCELVRHNAVIKENFLPGWAGLAAPVKAAIRARYRCITGTP